MDDERLLLIGFTFSNMASLVYEVVWGRELGYVFGTTAYAVSAVLAAFMTGLALGSFIFGRLADRQEPVRLFAFLELGIGVYGILTIWLFSALTHPYIFISKSLSGASFLFLQVALAMAVLLIPTTLIGGTFPVMSKIHARRFEQLGERISDVYSLDTIGAAAGAFASGFILIPFLGLARTTVFAAALNLLVGALIYQRLPELQLKAPERLKREVSLGAFEKTVLASFFLSGFAALTYEVVWTHMLGTVFSTSIYAFSTILTAFMAGLALGSYLVGKVVDRLKDPVGAFIYVELGIAVCAILLLSAFSKMDILFLKLYYSLNSSFVALFTAFFLLFFTLFLLPTTLMGSTMPLVSRIFTRALPEVGEDIGSIFSSNTLGGILGSLAGGFLLLPLLGVEKAIIAASLFNITSAALLFQHSKLDKNSFLGALAIFAAIGFLFTSYSISPLTGGAYYQGTRLERMEDYNRVKEQTEILFTKEDPHGVVAVTRYKGATSLLINGKIDASNGIEDLTTEYMLAYAPLMLHPAPEKVLNIGLGGGFTLSAIEDFNEVRAIDVVEINPAVVEATMEEFSELNDHALSDPRANLVVADARNFLLVNDRKYDVVISEPSNPWLGGESGLFTEEFYRLVKKRLEEDGVFVQWVPLYDLRAEDLKVLLKTFQKVFTHTHTFLTASAGDMIVVGSAKDMDYDYKLMKDRLSRPVLKRRFTVFAASSERQRTANQDIESFFSYYALSPEEVRSYASGARDTNRDDHPLIEFASARFNFMNTTRTSSILDIVHFKLESSSAILVSPPISNLTARVGERDVFGLFEMEVERGEDWQLEDVGFSYIQYPQGGFRILRWFVYHTDAGELTWIRIDNTSLQMSVEEMQQAIAEAQLVSLTPMGVMEKDGGSLYLFSDATRLFAAWQCGRPSLNVLILDSQDFSSAGEEFRRVRCLS